MLYLFESLILKQSKSALTLQEISAGEQIRGCLLSVFPQFSGFD